MHVGCWLSGRTGGLLVACPGFCPASFLDTSVRLGCPFVRHFFFLTFSDFWFSLFVHTLPCWGDWLFICSHALIIHCIVAFIYHSIAFYYHQDIILDLAVGENFFHLDLSCACSHFWNSDHPVKLSSRPIKLLSRGHTSTLLCANHRNWNNWILEISSKIKPTCWNTIHLPAKPPDTRKPWIKDIQSLHSRTV